MKIYKNQTVYEAAIERIRFLFNEFEEIIVGCSGGKDSTVVLGLCMEVAKELNRLPLKVLFLDQEAEWKTTIDYIEKLYNDKNIELIWLQMPIRISNATSHKETFLNCWEEGGDWIRKKHKSSIKENVFGTVIFYNIFGAYLKKIYKNKKACYISGVRTEESPSRYMGLTNYASYKYITYAIVLNKELNHYTFYPIYDWSFRDVWKYIYDNKLTYNKIYDYYYNYGVPIKQMRVSNLHHETAVRSLFILQEIEPNTWDKLVERLDGINTAGHIGKDQESVKELPFMFNSWKEYRDYLLENLIIDEGYKTRFKRKFKTLDKKYKGIPEYLSIKLYRKEVDTLIYNDITLTKLYGFIASPGFAYEIRRARERAKTDLEI